jgi:hypothetical protein
MTTILNSCWTAICQQARSGTGSRVNFYEDERLPILARYFKNPFGFWVAPIQKKVKKNLPLFQ